MKRFRDLAPIFRFMRSSDGARLAAMLVGFLFLFTPLAHGTSKNKLIKPGQLLIDGFRVRCGNTPALISERYPDYGAARRGLIILNPRKLRRLPRGAKLLIYYHECAHQHVGGSELAADCWAVKKVRRDGLMNAAGLKNACSFIERLPANRRHPSGKMRCQQLKRCYNDTYRRKARVKQKRNHGLKRRVLSNSGFSRPAKAFWHRRNHRRSR